MSLPPGKAFSRNVEAGGYLPLQDKPALDARGNIFVSDKNHGVYVLRHRQ